MDPRSRLSPVVLTPLLALGLLAAPAGVAAQEEPAGADTTAAAAPEAAPSFGACPDDLSTPVGAPGIAWGDTAAAASRLAGEIGGGSLAAAPVDTLIRRGDRAAAAGHHTVAYAAYAAAVEAGGGYPALWRASRASTDVGQDIGDDAEDWYERAESYARRAVEANADAPEGHLELARSLGLVALDANARQRVRMSEEIRAEARAAIEADSSYAGGWHVLGRWNKGVMELSGIARMFARTFLGGEVLGEASWEKAARYLDRAAELEPDRILHRLELGKVHRQNEAPELAREQLRKVLELPPTDFHDCVYKAEARELLGELEG